MHGDLRPTSSPSLLPVQVGRDVVRHPQDDVAPPVDRRGPDGGPLLDENTDLPGRALPALGPVVHRHGSVFNPGAREEFYCHQAVGKEIWESSLCCHGEAEEFALAEDLDGGGECCPGILTQPKAPTGATSAPERASEGLGPILHTG